MLLHKMLLDYRIKDYWYLILKFIISYMHVCPLIASR